jgi:hypothetical protein
MLLLVEAFVILNFNVNIVLSPEEPCKYSEHSLINALEVRPLSRVSAKLLFRGKIPPN